MIFPKVRSSICWLSAAATDLSAKASNIACLLSKVDMIFSSTVGISIRDLDLLTIGMVNDMYAESSNNEYNGYAQIATQMDFNAF